MDTGDEVRGAKVQLTKTIVGVVVHLTLVALLAWLFVFRPEPAPGPSSQFSAARAFACRWMPISGPTMQPMLPAALPALGGSLSSLGASSIAIYGLYFAGCRTAESQEQPAAFAWGVLARAVSR